MLQFSVKFRQSVESYSNRIFSKLVLDSKEETVLRSGEAGGFLLNPASNKDMVNSSAPALKYPSAKIMFVERTEVLSEDSDLLGFLIVLQKLF